MCLQLSKFQRNGYSLWNHNLLLLHFSNVKFVVCFNSLQSKCLKFWMKNFGLMMLIVFSSSYLPGNTNLWTSLTQCMCVSSRLDDANCIFFIKKYKDFIKLENYNTKYVCEKT